MQVEATSKGCAPPGPGTEPRLHERDQLSPSAEFHQERTLLFPEIVPMYESG